LYCSGVYVVPATTTFMNIGSMIAQSGVLTSTAIYYQATRIA
jgi:hypothetical protein